MLTFRYRTLKFEPTKIVGPGFVIRTGTEPEQTAWTAQMSFDDPDPDFRVCPIIIIAADQCNWRRCDDIVSQLIQKLEPGPGRMIAFQLGGFGRTLDSLSDFTVFRENCTGDGLPMFYSAERPETVPDIESACHRVSFQGSIRTHPFRERFWEAAQKTTGCVLKNTGPYFFAHVPDVRRALAREHHRLILDSQFVLCPRGESANSIRFFEALACGRIPVLISDSARLPLEGVIDYGRFVVRVPEGDVENLAGYIDRFPHDLRGASAEARAASLEFTDLRSFLDKSLGGMGET